MRITVLVATGLLASTLMAAGPVQAATMAPPIPSDFRPLRPPPGLALDPKAEVQELLRQATELDDNWDSLSPAQRNQRLAALQQQTTTVQRETNDLPANEQPEVQGMLNLVVLKLADILGKQLSSPNFQ